MMLCSFSQQKHTKKQQDEPERDVQVGFVTVGHLKKYMYM